MKQNYMTNRAIHFFLFDIKSGKSLLHKRDEMTDEQKEKWDLFGGNVRMGESYSQAFRRELYEELGIVSDGKEGVWQLKEDLYYLEFSKRSTRDLKLNEGAGFAWFSRKEISNLQNLTEYAIKELKQFYGRKGI